MEKNKDWRTEKRATSDEPIFIDGQLYKELSGLVAKILWPYKSANRELLQLRDQALFSFLFLAGTRSSETIQLKRKQFRVYGNRVEVANVTTVKHGEMRKRIILPREGNLKPLTEIFVSWLEKVPEESENFVFCRGSQFRLNFTQHISRKRLFQTVKLSGKFPHWARAVCANIYAKLFNNNAWKLQHFMGWKNLESSAPYIQGDWEEDENKIYLL